MTAICLIRHGETDWNALGKLQGRTDIPLNETGKRQAKETGEYLKHTSWDVIISSPLKRARETADIINQYLGLDIVEMEDFIERNYGDAEGMPFEERMKLYPDKNYPNQESKEALAERLMAGIQKVGVQYPDHKVLIVAHGAAIHALLSKISNGDADLENTKLVNACLSNISFLENKWHIQDYNVSDHLSD
ncbi:histidine phosphatase family protein [Bacillus sonorensis]|uniref:Phosphatase YhfR n=2 Tax=Bacillus sonorensis TaxID=119858 RepID=M5P7M6_9BACI|nr:MULTISPECIES: histidine phosphatase family protein [Bacillus]TWK72735.1 Phosphoserine phosphatase 1 [Bacillus paralicheniformis]ASB90226.1 putative phosphatase PhoE [Bacillus sonorensis]EME76001.1 phosphatase YhfR [Bacillus sonorensis L12]MBG9916583.1 phosphatase [Bacillus sonorensis]MCF7619466.1 histidine phosphatase family protein [Bacillus sonorensis]